MNEPTRAQKTEAGRLLGRMKVHSNIGYSPMSNRVERAQTAEEMEACLKKMRSIVSDLDPLPGRLKGRETLI